MTTKLLRVAVPAVVMAALAGCSPAATPTTSAENAPPPQTSDSGPESDPTNVQSATSSGTSDGSEGTVPSEPMITAPPTLPTATPSPVDAKGCVSGALAVSFPVANPVRNACVHMGTKVTIDLGVVQGFDWGPPVSSTPAVASLADQASSNGSHHVTVTLVHPGAVMFGSSSPYAADSHAPSSAAWSLALTVVP